MLPKHIRSRKDNKKQSEQHRWRTDGTVVVARSDRDNWAEKPGNGLGPPVQVKEARTESMDTKCGRE